MRNFIYVLFVSILLLSCDSKKEFYPTGELMKKYQLNEGKIDGVYEEYYKNGNLKEVHNYSSGTRVDSSLFYYENFKNQIKRAVYYNSNNTHEINEYGENGVKLREGIELINGHKVSKWNLYDQDGTLSQILEYMLVDGEEYLNQGWHFNKKGDTIEGKGNHIEFIMDKDSIRINEPVKFLIRLKQPLLSYKSDVFVCIPKGPLTDLKSDFSNVREIKWDTLPSIRDEGILENHEKYNLYVSFGLEFNRPGIKHIRGFLSENLPIDAEEIKSDSIDMKERKIYFDETIYVKTKD